MSPNILQYEISPVLDIEEIQEYKHDIYSISYRAVLPEFIIPKN